MNVSNQTREVTSSMPQEQKGALGLKGKNFCQIARNGFGDRHNAYPHSMAWFKNHLFVGTTRSVLILLRNHSEELRSWEVFPVKYPREIWELDLRGHIWRYHPPAQQWSRVFISPLCRAEDGSSVSVFNGVRNMLVFQGKSDTQPMLYALTMSHEKGPGGLMLRSEDGLAFEQLKISGIEGERFSSYRPLVKFKDHLYTAPVGKNKAQNSAGFAIVLETDDPVNGKWIQVNEVDFGDPSNLSVFEMAVFNGYLYAATINTNGFQLWKTDCVPPYPYRWKRILTHGAGRGSSNEGIASMCEFNGALYIGSIIQNGGFDRENVIGPSPSELIRVYPDDSWDIIVGNPRMTESGLKVPLSGFTAGFGNFFNGYFWRMCTHDGWLYLGTLDWSVFLPYAPRDKWTEQQRKMIDEYRTADVTNEEGGFDFWRSRDGVYWVPVTKTGFGNLYNYGVRTLCSTDYGLFLGTANPFGEDVAVQRTAGWFYEPNMQGGCEIWLGRQGSSDKQLKCYPNETAARAANASVPVVLSGAEENQNYKERLISTFYGNSHFRDFGLWNTLTKNAKEACENLIEELLTHLPAKTGKILALACRDGGATHFLRNYYPAEAITGVCLEKKEFDRARNNVAGVTFLRPFIPHLGEKDPRFNTVISLEQLSGYRTGLDWLKEAVRLLVPGGYLLCSEILSQNIDSPWKKGDGLSASLVTTVSGFGELLGAIGLESVKTFDCTAACWQAFRKHLNAYLYEKLLAGEIDEEILDEITQSLYGCYGQIYAYVLAVGRKPFSQDGKR